MGVWCILCIASQKRLDPGVTLEECQEKLQLPEYKMEFMRARQAIAEELEENEKKTLPTFVPSLQIGQQNRYGHQIYTKGALISEVDLIKACGKSGETLGLSPWRGVDYNNPGSNQTFYVVALHGMPDELRHSLKRIKIFHEVSAVRDSFSVTPATQLSALQSETCFTHAASQYQTTRPTAAMSGELQSIQDLKELGEFIDTELNHQLEEAAAQQGESLQYAIDSRTKADPGTTGASKALAGLTLDSVAPVPKKTAKKRPAKATEAAAVSASAAPPALQLQDASAPGPPGAPTRADSASSKRQKDREGELANMDEEMQRVALKHTAGKATTSAKSLALLVPDVFMQPGSDHGRGHSLVAVTCLFDAGG